MPRLGLVPSHVGDGKQFDGRPVFHRVEHLPLGYYGKIVEVDEDKWKFILTKNGVEMASSLSQCANASDCLATLQKYVDSMDSL